MAKLLAEQEWLSPSHCLLCGPERFDMPIRMAFQPIVAVDGTVFAQEALVRGPGGEGAGFVLAKVGNANRFAFEQACRIAAIRTAAALRLRDCLLSININPNAVYDPARCLRSSLAAARRAGLPNEALMFELAENERPLDVGRLREVVTTYRAAGFTMALDDFGTMHANLDMLAELRPDVLKADIALVRGIDADTRRRAIMRALTGLCHELGIRLVAEGVERPEEFSALRDLGVELFQGFLLARPALEALARPVMPGG